MTTNTETPTLDDAARAIEDELGYSCKVWQGRRVYIRDRSKDLGYIDEDDLSGSTGTCRHVQRSGSIARVLRGIG